MKTTQSELILLFATPVIRSNIGRNFTKEEVDCFANIPMVSEQPVTLSEHFDILDNFAEELKDINLFLEHEITQYLEDIEGVDTDIANLRISQSWLNKIKPQGYHPMHNHRNSYLSGVLYIKCLPNDYIQFSNRNRIHEQLEFPRKRISPYIAEGASINIKEGDFILFPSLVQHEVGVNETKDKERISLSFDTFPTNAPSSSEDGDNEHFPKPGWQARQTADTNRYNSEMKKERKL